MNIDLVLEMFQSAWALVPFPLLLIYLVLLGFAWLYGEYQVTRVTRRTPGYRNAPPILPSISLGMLWLIKFSRILVWIWVIFFLTLLLSMLADEFVFGYNSDIGKLVLEAGRNWHAFYSATTQAILNLVPDSVPFLGKLLFWQ